MKTIGFKNYSIAIIHGFELVLIFIVSYIMSFGGYILINYFFNKYYISNKIVLSGLYINFNYNVIGYIALIFFVVLFIMIDIFDYRVKKTNISNMLGDN